MGERGKGFLFGLGTSLLRVRENGLASLGTDGEELELLGNSVASLEYAGSSLRSE
ncbi:hypothetical protein SAMN05421771_2999 [Granulicella pectinivorans]|uniref:Uncharacterized protein n=1 Tax=Granulicella pectinivorans TaxID=474950 RepID=A0A1I6MMT1_9BACT|nr:hypothetical protein SAMN05421771_2999 [Granulicella pectinivorans]